MTDTGPKVYTEAAMQRMRDELARWRASKDLTNDDVRQENKQLLAACDAIGERLKHALAENVALKRLLADLEPRP